MKHITKSEKISPKAKSMSGGPWTLWTCFASVFPKFIALKVPLSRGWPKIMNFIFGSSLPWQWVAGRLPKLENVKCGGHVSITRGKSFQHALILQFAELQFAQLQFAGLQFGELRSKKQSFRLQSFSLQVWVDSEKMSLWKAVSWMHGPHPRELTKMMKRWKKKSEKSGSCWSIRCTQGNK